MVGRQPGSLLSYAAFRKVFRHGAGASLSWISETPTPGGHYHQPVVGGDRLEALALELLAGFERYRCRLTVATTILAARRMIDAVEGRQQLEGLADPAADLDLLAEAATGFSGAA